VKNAPVTLPEWENLLRQILLQAPTSTHTDIQLVATVTSTALTLIFRKSTSGIHQRLGEIALAKNDDHELDTLTWLSTSIARSSTLETQMAEIQRRADDQQATIAKLTQQLDELVAAKAAHEGALLEKFCELLNAKKMKIRDQQRLLAGARVDPAIGTSLTHNHHPSRLVSMTGLTRTNSTTPRAVPLLRPQHRPPCSPVSDAQAQSRAQRRPAGRVRGVWLRGNGSRPPRHAGEIGFRRRN